MKRTILVLTMMVFTTTISAALPTDSLVGYWPFNANSLDESGNNNDGSNIGVELVADRFGNDSSAYYFDANDHITINSTNLPHSLTDAYTFSVWMNPDSSVWVAGWRTVLFMGQNSPNAGTQIDYQQPIENSHRISHGTYGNGLDSTKSGGIFNTWNHVVATYDGTTRKTYLNGVLFGEDSYSSLNITSMAMEIGRREHSFLGSLDDIRVYSKALNATDIMNLYNERMYTDTTYVTIFDTTYTTINETLVTDVFDTTHIMVYDSISVTDTLIITVAMTGIAPPNNMNTIKVFPNVAHDMMYINTGDNYANMSAYTIKILNTLGTTVFENLVDQQLFTIDLSTLGEKGIYFLQIIDATSQIIDIRKVILQ